MNRVASKKANWKKLEQFVSLAFRKAGLPGRDAELAAKILVDADLRGIDSHGVMNLSGYVGEIRDGAINPNPRMKAINGSPTTVSMNGDNGLGLLVSYRAMEESMKMARSMGSGWVTVCNSNHSGAGAYYVLMAAKENMIGIHSSSGGSTVAAPGGKRRLIGNNVIAFAAPAGKHGPFVLDMAPTMAIANKLHKLQWEGKSMPAGWAIDSEGRPVTDPNVYFGQEGAILPLGSTAANGVHKGFGLLLVSDILTGLLSGDGGSMLRKKGKHTHVFCALRIDGFPTADRFTDLMDEMIEKLHATPTVEGMSPIRYPGERGNQTYRERSAKGIPLRQEIVDDLRKMGKDLNLPLDEIWER